MFIQAGARLGHYEVVSTLGAGGMGVVFQLLGPPADRKAHITFEGGHIPLNIHQVIGRILEWLDRYLGPVSN